MLRFTKKEIFEKKCLQNSLNSFQKTKLTRSSESVSTRCILRVRKTKIELELKKKYCFLGAWVNHSSDLIFFKLIPYKSH